MKISISLILLLIVTTMKLHSQTIQVDVDKPTSKIQSTMWGIFFEDINFGADGGLYAELVKNRSFEFALPTMGWKVDQNGLDQSSLLIVNRSAEKPQNPRYARVTLINGKDFNIVNDGFRGMGVKENNVYHFSVLASLGENSKVTMNVSLIDTTDKVLGSASINLTGMDWKKYKADFTCSKTDANAKLKIQFVGDGVANIDMVSLFPDDTWKHREGGLRADLVQKLADLHPGFFRFPGGCIVEGRDLTKRYQWKKTVGPVEDRKMIVNRWNTQTPDKQTPDYYQTFGIGFYEYFLLSEDIGAEPLPILNCGMACQFNTAEVVDLKDLGPYVQDALDLIEFANGSTDTKWGKLRADMGHPKPFNLKFMGVGNEQWGPQYFERYAVFEKAISEKYPDIKLISTTGPAPDDHLFKYAKKRLEEFHPAIVDEHYYNTPQWFFDHATRYDNYDRNSYKIFAGEYAAQSQGVCRLDNKNTWLCALSEAAYMTGLERNADVVNMCSYAPLFASVDAWQWTPNLIWFNSLQSLATPDYYVQQLYGENKGTDLLKTTMDGKALTGQDGLYSSSVWDANTNEVVVKVVNNNKEAKSTIIELNSAKKYVSKAKMTVLSSSNLDGENTMDKPDQIVPKDSEIKVSGKNVKLDLEPYSFTVIRIKQR